MARLYDDNSLSIGNTPLVRLNRVVNGTARFMPRLKAVIPPIP
jgi:hypothetical protein